MHFTSLEKTNADGESTSSYKEVFSVPAAVTYSDSVRICKCLCSGLRRVSLCWTAAVRDDLTVIHQQVSVCVCLCVYLGVASAHSFVPGGAAGCLQMSEP